jgi:SAM-dependent methyltransferase
MSAPENVARYYDRNTERFLRFGGGVGALAIHRELWGPGVTSSEEAKRYVNGLIADEVASIGAEAPLVLDLGCGVGGTLFELAGRFPRGRMHGVTISRAQHDLAAAWASRLGLDDRCAFDVGDFHDLALWPPRTGLRADAVIAVESFAHARDPAAFFRTAARHLKPKGRLILLDDFLVIPRADLTGSDAAGVDRFERGWRLGTLLGSAECREVGRSEGLTPIDDHDLTPLIRLGRPRDRAIATLAPLLERLGLGRIPFCGNMIGGNALQQGLRTGVLSYRMLTFTGEG